MMKSLTTLALAAALSSSVLMTNSQPAEARRGSAIAGIVVGAVIGGLIAREIARSHRRRTYRTYHDTSYGYAYRPYRNYGYYGCSGWRCY